MVVQERLHPFERDAWKNPTLSTREDPIMAELRAVPEAYAEKFDYDVDPWPEPCRR